MDLETLLKDDKPDGYCEECGEPFWQSYLQDHKKVKSHKRFCSEKCNSKKCQREWVRKDYATNPEKYKKKLRDYRLKNPERVKIWQINANRKQKEDPNYKEKQKANYKKWYYKDVEHARAVARKCRLKNIEKRRLSDRAYYLKKKERVETC